MKDIKVGVIGCSGKVGKIACKVLSEKYFIVGGQRNIKKETNSFCDDTKYVDVYDNDSLRAFCKGCSVVLNCAGPSYIIGERVALIAVECGANYVDVFGGNILERKLQHVRDKGCFVISAGCTPGLTGVLAKLLSLENFSKIDKLSIYSGGQESGSKNACADIILSSINGYGIPGAFLKNSSIIHEIDLNANNSINLNGIEEPVYVQKYLTAEMVKLSQCLKIPNIDCFQMFSDIKVKELIGKGCIKIASLLGSQDIWPVIEHIVEENNKLSSYKKGWFAILGKIEGEIEENLLESEIIISGENSSIISGYIAALVVEEVLGNKYNNGIYWPFEVLNPEKTIEALEKFNAIKFRSSKNFLENQIMEINEEGII